MSQSQLSDEQLDQVSGGAINVQVPVSGSLDDKSGSGSNDTKDPFASGTDKEKSTFNY